MNKAGGRAEARLRTAEGLLTLAYLAAVMWYLMIPQHTRRLLRMRVMAAGQKMAGNAARHAGRASMGAELATGHARYEIPYTLALVADAAGRAYDRLREVTL